MVRMKALAVATLMIASMLTLSGTAATASPSGGSTVMSYDDDDFDPDHCTRTKYSGQVYWVCDNDDADCMYTTYDNGRVYRVCDDDDDDDCVYRKHHDGRRYRVCDDDDDCFYNRYGAYRCTYKDCDDGDCSSAKCDDKRCVYRECEDHKCRTVRVVHD